MSKIGIIDYSVGNIGAIANMCSKVGIASTILKDKKDINEVSHLILPGVGHFDVGMRHLMDSGWDDILKEHVLVRKTPILGICLGMQLLCRESEEGREKGLGWINAHVVKFKQGVQRVPHMGWNKLEHIKDDVLFDEHDQDERYYFMHSYYVECDHQDDVLCRTNYGRPFVSVFKKNHIYGVQFHPEKSHRFGMTLIKNFIKVA